MKKPNKQNMKHATPAREVRALREDELRGCAGGWDIPAGEASPSS